MKGVRKALRRHRFEVYDVNEDNTSQLCNGCKKKVEPMCFEGGHGAIYKVRRCVTADCIRTTLHRYLNAALDILYVLRSECVTGVRLVEFTRKYKTALARAAVS